LNLADSELPEQLVS